MASLRKILEALGRVYTRSGYQLPGPWMVLVRPPPSPHQEDGR